MSRAAGSGQHEDHHGHDHGGANGHGSSWRSRAHHTVAHLLSPHSHDAGDKVDSAMEASREGIRTLWISLAVLAATALLQALVVALSGSVALLGDTIHNGADALTALPLGLAFLVGRRPATRSYTYGYGRAEDLAGIAIVMTITASSALAGFAGNEWVARYRIRTGRRIGSAAPGRRRAARPHRRLHLPGRPARRGGTALGWEWADPAVGLLITIAILTVLRDAARQVCRRLMDAVDPAPRALRGSP